MPPITSRQHPIVKQFRALARGDDAGRLLLDGWHLVGEALEAGMRLDTVVVSTSPARREPAILARLGPETRLVEASPAVMHALSPVRTPTGVVASAHRPHLDVPRRAAGRRPLVVAACGLQDPGNVGALVRAAAASGATAVVVDAASADPWGWKALRASMGAAFHVPLARVEGIEDALVAWRGEGLAVLAAVPRGGTPMADVDFTRPTAILIGGEGPGLPDAALARVDGRVSIPMHPPVESLNAAVAAAVLLYEARRQRTPAPAGARQP